MGGLVLFPAGGKGQEHCQAQVKGCFNNWSEAQPDHVESDTFYGLDSWKSRGLAEGRRLFKPGKGKTPPIQSRIGGVSLFVQLLQIQQVHFGKE